MEQEAVKACVRTKYPDNRVNVAVATNPDLAIVQGAAHYGAGQQRPSTGASAAAQYRSIISSTSYGILVEEVRRRILSIMWDHTG